MLKVKRTTLNNHKRAGVAVLISGNTDLKMLVEIKRDMPW